MSGQNEIEPLLEVLNLNLLEFKVQSWAGNGKATMPARVDTYQWDIRATVQALRVAPCARSACFRHIRDLDGSFICSDHWGAQLAAIA
jgi:hypothetical protein